MADKIIYFNSPQGSGSVIIDDAIAGDTKKILERIQDLTGITHQVEIVNELPPVVEVVTSDSLQNVMRQYIETKAAFVPVMEDTSLWDLKYELAVNTLAGDKEALSVLKNMLTKKDFDKFKKNAESAVEAVAQKIVDKQQAYRLKILQLDSILRNYKQTVEGVIDAQVIANAEETAIRQLKLLVKE